MRNKKIGKTKKLFAILLVLSFLLSILAVSATAAENKDNDKNGYDKGYLDGKKQGQKVCKQYGPRETLVKIPSHNYINGYKEGFLDGYNAYRYNCLSRK